MLTLWEFTEMLQINYRVLLRKELYTDKKDNKIFLIQKEIQMGSGAKSYKRKGFVIYEEMRKFLKFFPIYEEAVSHI